MKLFGGTIVAAATNPLAALVIDEDLYINRALGIAFRKPKGWHFLTIKQFSDLADQQVLKDSRYVSELGGAEDPIAVISQTAQPSQQGFSPAITVYVEEFDFGKNETLIDLAPEMERGHELLLDDYEVVTAVEELTISNCPSIEFLSKFRYVTTSFSTEARNRCVVSDRRPLMYTVNMFDYPTQSMDTQAVFDQFVKSIYYV